MAASEISAHMKAERERVREANDHCASNFLKFQLAANFIDKHFLITRKHLIKLNW